MTRLPRHSAHSSELHLFVSRADRDVNTRTLDSFTHMHQLVFTHIQPDEFFETPWPARLALGLAL